LRGDISRLMRCTAIHTASEDNISRSKPFKYAYEKEIVMYAYFKKLDYFSTECIYAPNAYRGHSRTFLKDLEAIRPSAIIGQLFALLPHTYNLFSMKYLKIRRCYPLGRGL